jgi:hypothetical protein
MLLNFIISGGEEAMEFMERCEERGIPPEIMKFSNIWKVRATRSLGYGSPQLRDMATKELVGMAPMMDAVSRNHAMRARAAALPGIGQSGVDQFFPKIEKSGVPNAQASYAMMENNALRQPGGKTLVEPKQDHSTHFDVHYKDTMEHLQDQQSQPLQKLIHVEQAGPHMHQHLDLIKGDPTKEHEFKQKKKMLDALSKTADQLGQHVKESLRSQKSEVGGQNGQQGQPDPEAQAAQMKMHGELGLKAEKQKGEMILKARGQAFKEHLEDQKTAAEIRRKNRTPSSPASK